jgi:hypothetical protein
VRRGAPDAAAELLRLACQLTPPTEIEALSLRRVAYGRLLHSAGDIPAAIAELDSLVTSLPPGLLRARALFHFMYVLRLSGSLGRAIEVGVQAAAEAAADPSFQGEVYELLSRLSDDDIARKLDAARRGLEAIAGIAAPDPDVAFFVRAAMVEAEFYAGLGIHLDRLDGMEPGTVVAFRRPAPRRGGTTLSVACWPTPAASTRDWRPCEGCTTGRRWRDGRSCRRRSAGWPRRSSWRAGSGVAAELTREAIERAEETGHQGGFPWEVGFHAVALAMLGRLDAAGTTATEVTRRAEADPSIEPDTAPRTAGPRPRRAGPGPAR